MKTKYDIVFVVLVYRNTQDLKDFFAHNNVPNSQTVVVNSFYDETSEAAFKAIAEKYGADFISVPNKGYGAGNNKGCDFAIKNYDFQYLIISNADILIEHLDIKELDRHPDVIMAPQMRNLSGKNQNPSGPFVPFRLQEWLAYKCYKGRHRHLIYFFYAFSRMKKILYYVISRYRKKIFSAHGAFVIIPKNVLQQLHPIYNEEVFLFHEEPHLGFRAKEAGIKTFYVPDILIKHKEDGSMKVASVNEFELMRQSYMTYYKYWYKNKR